MNVTEARSAGIKLCAWCLLTLAIAPSLPAAEESPLDQLRDRSAEKRWKSMRQRVTDRRVDRKDRKGDLPATPHTAGNHEAGLLPSQPLSTPALQDNLPPAAPAASEWKNNASPLPVPAAAPQKPAPVALQPNPADQTLYRELFQLETTPVSARTSSHPAENLELSPAPHPGMLAGELPLTEVSASREVENQVASLKVPSAVPQPVTSEWNSGLPFLPLPSPRGAEMQTAYQDRAAVPAPSGTVPAPQGQVLLKGYLFESSDYDKEIGNIMPFANYEPNVHVDDAEMAAEFRSPKIIDLPNQDVSSERNFAHLEYAWAASNINYFPLYFEDVNLERYGHSHHPIVQPFVSVGKFSGQLLALPYMMTMNQVAQPTYPLGYLPPGDEGTPKVYYRPRINMQAAMVTVGVYTGWFFVIP